MLYVNNTYNFYTISCQVNEVSQRNTGKSGRIDDDEFSVVKD